jgi:uncharacterized lipoprotein YmbA
MKTFFLQHKLMTLLILLPALAGCVTQPSPPTNFYMMAPLSPSTEKMSAETEKRLTVIAIATVLVPSYLDRNQIVTRLGVAEYELAEFDQWVEPVGENLTRVVAENLSRLLAADNADVFPAAREVPHDYSIGIEVIRLDGNLGDQVMLIARWAIFGADDEDLIMLRKFEHQEKTENETYKGLVLAQSRAVEKLSQDISEAMKKTMENRSNR